MTINQKLLQYAEFKRISQRKFTTSLGLSEGVLRKGKNIGSGYLKKVKEKYHDLNMNWLLFDEGNMIIEPDNILNEAAEKYQKEYDICKKLKIELQHSKELIAAKNETISILNTNLVFIMKTNQVENLNNPMASPF